MSNDRDMLHEAIRVISIRLDNLEMELSTLKHDYSEQSIVVQKQQREIDRYKNRIVELKALITDLEHEKFSIQSELENLRGY